MKTKSSIIFIILAGLLLCAGIVMYARNGSVTSGQQTTTTDSTTVDTATATAAAADVAPAWVDSVPHKGFVYVKKLIPDLIEDLRYLTSNNFMGSPADGYQANRVILTQEAATALKGAADEFRKMGYVIQMFDAYRPQAAVNHFVRWAQTDDQRNKADYYPTIAKQNLFPKYIARKSGHSRGSTVDMTIADKETGQEVDMGCHFDFFGEPSWPAFVGTWHGITITEEHHAMRMLLREVMMRHGFKPYDNEWWHFTLKNEPYPKTFFEFPVK